MARRKATGEKGDVRVKTTRKRSAELAAQINVAVGCKK
jgi:hypothetical protein